MALTQISTAGVKDDAVTSGKIPANAVGSSELADNAVDTAAIAANAVTASRIADSSVQEAKINNGAVTVHKIGPGSVNSSKIADATIGLDKLVHGTSANDGKFLRANNGADPSFETVTSTTINNNAANRVITGSGTANTLNANSDLLWNGSRLDIDTGGTEDCFRIGNSAGCDTALRIGSIGTATDTHGVIKYDKDDNYLSLLVSGESHGNGGILIANGGNVGKSTTSPAVKLDVNGKIHASTSIGIRTTSPQQNLHVHQTDSGASVVKFTNSTTTIGSGNGFDVGLDSSEHGFLNVKENKALQFATNNSERMRITSSGEVGINLTDPEAYGANGNGYAGLTVEAPSGDYSGITIRSNYAGAGSLQFADGSGSTAERRNGYIDFDHVNKRFNIGIEGSSKIRITENGFHPNPSDSAEANALDDYEEGTWTPTFGGQLNPQSYSQQLGQYTKIGNFVIASCQLKLAGDPGSYASNVHIDGLPFAGKTGGTGDAAVLAYQTNFNSATDGRGNFTGMVNPTQSTIRFYTPDGTYYLWSEVNDRDEQIRVTATYRTN